MLGSVNRNQIAPQEQSDFGLHCLPDSVQLFMFIMGKSAVVVDGIIRVVFPFDLLG